MNEETIAIVKTGAEELLNLMTITAAVTVEATEESLLVTIESDEAGILIGFHGRNLEAMQNILSQMVFKKTGTWVRILVSVGDYRERREKQLKDIAYTAASQVVQGGQPVTLEELSASERRVVHMALQDHPEVMSESVGEGRDRRLVVKLRAAV